MTDEEKQLKKKQIRKIVTKKLNEIQTEIFYNVITATYNDEFLTLIDNIYGSEISRCYETLIEME